MEKPLETIEYKGFTIEIYQDEFNESPRDWDTLGKMVCWHSRYNLGDEQPKCDPHEYMHSVMWGEGLFYDDILYTDEQDKKIEKKFNEVAISLPLYLYDHSGITMNTTGFSCPWDSGQVGFIYALKRDILKEWKRKKWSKRLEKLVIDNLKNEVKTYDQYLTGDVYGFRIIEPYADDNLLDSCWGYYGRDFCIQEAKSTADYWAKERDSGEWEKSNSQTGMED